MYKLVEGPLLQQILVHRDAMIPITMKIRVVTRKPMSISLRCWREKPNPAMKKRNSNRI